MSRCKDFKYCTGGYRKKIAAPCHPCISHEKHCYTHCSQCGPGKIRTLEMVNASGMLESVPLACAVNLLPKVSVLIDMDPPHLKEKKQPRIKQ